MKFKTYRICLLSLVIIAVIGGIIYYVNSGMNRELEQYAGTFVEKIIGEAR
ncbi:MAG: hypothetical protein K2O73_06970 [Lachnospiraceae bacterium]|nr:hypothetical protein [Lachnospiraceae bacterium]MDE7434307.1 hypothetical protein [Lachnospiraceae bacterium]